MSVVPFATLPCEFLTLSIFAITVKIWILQHRLNEYKYAWEEDASSHTMWPYQSQSEAKNVDSQEEDTLKKDAEQEYSKEDASSS